eukprot:gene54686-73071_t
MCYSALVWADFQRYVREFGARVNIDEFYDLFWRRKASPAIKVPKALEAAFNAPATDVECSIKALIDGYADEQETK